MEEQNNILEMRLERHNLQVGTKTSLQLFSVMDLLVWHKGTNLITPRAAAHMTLQIDLQKSFPYLTVFQAQLDPGVIPAASNGKVVEPVADLKFSFIG